MSAPTRASGGQTRFRAVSQPPPEPATVNGITPVQPETEPAIVVPKFVTAPTMGWLGTRYAMNERRGSPHKVPHLKRDFVTPTPWGKFLIKLDRVDPSAPQISKKELAALNGEQARLDAVYEAAKRAYDERVLDQTIIILSDRVGAQRVCVINTKGSSSRTTTVTHMASVHGTVTLTSIAAIDFNLASGNMGRRFGRDFGQTLRLSQLVGGHADVDVFRDFIRPIRPTRYNVRVVSADNIIQQGRKPGKDAAIRAMNAVYDHCEFLYMDTLNLITEPVALANVDFSDVLVFVANVGEQESLRQLGTSKETLRAQGFTDKVNNSVVAISNVPDGMEAMDYKHYLHVVNDHNEVVSETGRDWRGKLVGIPHDPYIPLVLPVDLDALQYETRMAYKRLVIAALQQNPMFRNNPSGANVELADMDVGEKPERETFKGFKFFEPVSH